MNDNSPLMEIIRARRSVRSFADRPVPREIVLSCIEAARHAPSAQNVQPCRFLVLDEKERIEKFSSAAFGHVYAFNRWVKKAPVVVVLLAKLDVIANRIGRFIQGTPYYLVDGGIAGEHFVLRAHELGLGTCWVGWYNNRALVRELKIPRGYRIVQCIALGYPDAAVKGEKKRRTVEEITCFNDFDFTSQTTGLYDK